MSDESRAAVLTPPGAAAVATIAVVGPSAWAIIRSAFSGCKLPTEADPSRHWFGQFGEPPSDTVVLSVRRAIPSPWIEIHCHGGPQVVRWLLENLGSHGAQHVSWEELVRTSEPSPLRAEAAVDLARAVTLRTAAILLDQYHGALDAKLMAIVEQLDQGQIEAAQVQLASVVQFAELGRRLTRPWRVVIAGAPNVGKSSLVNRLVGYPRCVVTPTPGTTRDIVATSVAIDGWPVELIDTAGQRDTTNALEQAGVALASQTTRAADLVIWMVDATNLSPMTEDAPPHALIVRNKIDLVPNLPPEDGTISISALTGVGLDELLLTIAARLVPCAPPSGAAVPFSAAIADCLMSVANLLGGKSVHEAAAMLRQLLAKGVAGSGPEMPLDAAG